MSALYLFYLLAALLWNATAAAAHRKDATLARAHRVAALAGFALCVVGLTWVGATSAFGTNAWIYGLSAALPLAALAAAAQCAIVARAGRRWTWLAAGYNALLAVALGSRWAAYLGAPVGVAGESLSLSLVGLQFFAFTPALWFPAFVPLPLLARPRKEEAALPGAAWNVWLAFCGITLALVLWGWPQSAAVIGSWRAHTAPASPALPARAEPLVRSTRVLETLARDRPERFFERDLALVGELGLEAATVVVSSDALADPGELWAKLERFARELRAGGRKLVLWLQPPTVWYRSGIPSRAEAVRVLAAAQRDFAIRFHPDVQIVTGDPIFVGELLGRAGAADSARWAIAALADSVHAGSPATLVAAYGLEDELGGPDSTVAARLALFRWAAADASPVDRVGFALHPGFGDTALFARRLAHAAALLDSLGATKLAWVFEFGVCPVTFGERAQRRHLEWVMSWARAQPRVEGVSQTALGDYAEVVGLTNALGRRREAFEAYRSARP